MNKEYEVKQSKGKWAEKTEARMAEEDKGKTMHGRETQQVHENRWIGKEVKKWDV